MAVASMLVSTRWLEYLIQLDQDETSKRDQPLVRLFSPVSGSQIVESDEKWRAEQKTRKNGNLHRKMTDLKDFVECGKIASGGICPVKESTRTVLLVYVAVKIRSQVKPVFRLVRLRISCFSALIICIVGEKRNLFLT